MASRKGAEIRKQEIVEAVIRLADEVGPDRLTTEAIARDVGITQPAVFRHFPKKQTLWEAVANHISGRMQKRWARALAPRRGAEDQLQALIGAQLKFIRSNPAIPAILFSRELHSGNELLRTAFHALMGRLHAMVVRVIERGIEEGRFAQDLDVRDSAYLVLGLVQGLAVRWSVSGKNFDIVDEGERLLRLQMKAFAVSRQENDGGAMQ